ncbi:unnamed protein product [Trifolium pratense]|uniref:Uncharacterized protein n=1 Tax=Trifolium pratense TaxID=57577 RepID=A0ACB0J7D3_TRIPR|nr:unnamed protein product [Trifolium pratense]
MKHPTKYLDIRAKTQNLNLKIEVEMKVNTLSHDYFGLKSESNNEKVSFFIERKNDERIKAWGEERKWKEIENEGLEDIKSVASER